VPLSSYGKIKRGNNMQEKVFEKLQPGDIVKSNVTNINYIVTANYGNRMVAVCTADLTNPKEWTLISKVKIRTSR